MRSILFILCIFILLPVQSQVSEDFRNRENISKNHVKTQISRDYKYTGDKAEKNGVKTSVTTYAASGDVVQTNALSPGGDIMHTEKYTYDTKGNKTEYTRQSGIDSYQKKYVYNDKDLIIEESGFDGVENFKNQYTYNAHGEITEIRYHKNSGLFEKRVFIKDGVTTNVSVYNRTGTLTSRLVLIYDGRGNLVEESVFGINENPIEKKTYNYDDKRKLKEEARYKLNKLAVRNTYNYTPSGALSEITEESPGNQKYVKKSLVYDPTGNLTEIKWRRKGTEDFNRISYQYDIRGLCISAETYYPATKYHVLTKYEYEYF